MMKKAIKFRLCGKAHSLSILDFAKCLGLYNNAEVQEYRFKTCFIGGLRNDDDFSADQYWLNISSEEALTLSRKHVLRVLQKMITYGLCQRTTDYDRVDEEKGSWNTERKLDMIVVPGIANQNGNGNVVAARVEGNGNGNNENEIRGYKCQGVDHYARNCTVKLRKKEAAHLKSQLQIAQKEETGIQLNSEEFDFMVAAGAYDEIEEVNANCTLTDNLQQASTSGTQTDSAPIYDSDGSAEVHHAKNCYDNDIFNMFTQKKHYTELLEPIYEPHQVQQNDINVISVVSSAKQSQGTVEQNSTTVEETRVYF
ncbi:hypothetical protein Tco_1211184 [Tanacetum coccineum]